MGTLRRDGLHALLMFLATIPFYLYGGNVLFGHRLFEDIKEVALFIMRAGITVVVVEALLNWLPYHGLQLIMWRNRYSSVLLSGALFGILSYFVITPRYFEGEAAIGMGAVWIVAGILLNKLFKKKLLYD
jgi:hypothetical protein